MRKSIVIRLFLINALVLTLFIGAVIVFQALFFESFYIQTKKEKIISGIEGFVNSYTAESWNSDQAIKNINKFVDDYNAQLAVLDKNGLVKYTNTYSILLQSESGDKVTIPLSNVAFDADAIVDLQLSEGDSITVEGVYNGTDKSAFTPSSIQKDGRKWTSLDKGFVVDSITVEPFIQLSPQIKSSSGSNNTIIQSGNIKNFLSSFTIDTETISGIIKELNIPLHTKYLNPFSTSNLLNTANSLYWSLKSGEMTFEGSKLVTYNYTNKADGSRYMIFAKPLSKTGKAGESPAETVLCSASLQPVGEAIEVMKDYYVYVFLIAIAVIVILSLIYSRTVAKPLIQMNRAAAKMAELDFSIECNMNRQDEIGSLASSLNKLAVRLDGSLKDLREANEQLLEDIEKEKALESMRKDFVASASHELKTPLGIMMAFAEGIRDGIYEDKKEHYLSVILEEGQKMNALVLDMLELAKLEAKGYTLKKDCFDLYTLIKNTTERFIRDIHQKEINVQFDIEEREILVFADEARIEQVLKNLFSNAVRYTDQKGRILITEKRCNETVYLSVENSGRNIPEAKLSHIWDRFYRVEESRDRKMGGTGLGLSIVKNILELHNFKYGVQNTEVGVSFYIFLDAYMWWEQ